MIIDFHMHCGRDKDGSNKGYQDIQWMMRKHAIDKSVVFGFNSKYLIEKSEEILWESKTNKNLIPFVRIDPTKITKEQLHDTLQHGFKGIKLHPRSQNFEPDDKKFTWLFEEVAQYKIPILIHTRNNPQEPESMPRRVIALAIRFPEQIFVCGHFCGADLSAFLEMVDLPNIYAETSVCAIHYYIEQVVNEIGFDRLLYGSDFPYSLPEVELPKVLRADIPREIKEKILWKNAVKILNLQI